MKTIIEIAREAGIEVTYDPTETPTRAFVECWIEDLEHLVDLARADEREACEALCKWRTGIQQVDAAIDTCAAAIRARGNT